MAEEDRPLKKVKFSPNVSIKEFDAHRAADTVQFHALYSTTVEELELEKEIALGGQPFRCEFYNQVFGDSEEINGYKGLQVDVWLALNSYHCWVDVRWEDKRPGADDVVGLLQEWWQQPFTTSRQEFLQRAAAAPAHDFAELGQPLSTLPGPAPGQQVQLHHARMADTPGWFKELHGRMQPLLIFTIDGANYIDTSDLKWEVVAAVLERDNKQQLIGFMMMYNFYAWPLNQRPRVSQVMVLPPLQGAGYGKALVKAAYDLACQRDAVDLTFEDPAPGLQRLREKLELEMMLACPWMVEAAAAALAAAEAEEMKQQAAAKQLWETVEKSRRQQTAAAQQQQEPAGSSSSDAAVAGQRRQQQQQPNGTSAASAGPVGSNEAGTATAGNGGAAAAAAAEEEDQEGHSPASLLTMPAQLQQRVTKELKIHKHQVYAVWESLLFLQVPGCLSAEHSLAEALQEFVMTRLEVGTAPMADRHAAHKRMVAVQDKQEDWFVYKVPRALRGAAGGGGDGGGGGLGLLSDTVNMGRRTLTQVNADDWGNRLQEMTGRRMDQLVQMKLKMRQATMNPKTARP